MYRLKRVATMVFGATLLASLVLGGSALAKDAKSMKLHLTSSRDSGVSGTATLTDVEEGVKVELHMQGLPEAGVEHINHIYGGRDLRRRSSRIAPVTIPLNTVVANADGSHDRLLRYATLTTDDLAEKQEKESRRADSNL